MTTTPVMSITDEQIAELEAACSKATPGPWRECGADRGGCSCGLVWSRAADLPVAEAWRGDEEAPEPAEGAPANAAFIAKADPSTILALIARLRAAEKDAGRYRYWSRMAAHEPSTMARLIAHCSTRDEYDASIDAAKKGEKP